jgi:hypothetical protein
MNQQQEGQNENDSLSTVIEDIRKQPEIINNSSPPSDSASSLPSENSIFSDRKSKNDPNESKLNSSISNSSKSISVETSDRKVKEETISLYPKSSLTSALTSGSNTVISLRPGYLHPKTTTTNASRSVSLSGSTSSNSFGASTTASTSIASPYSNSSSSSLFSLSSQKKKEAVVIDLSDYAENRDILQMKYDRSFLLRFQVLTEMPEGLQAACEEAQYPELISRTPYEPRRLQGVHSLQSASTSSPMNEDRFSSKRTGQELQQQRLGKQRTPSSSQVFDSGRCELGITIYYQW